MNKIVSKGISNQGCKAPKGVVNQHQVFVMNFDKLVMLNFPRTKYRIKL